MNVWPHCVPEIAYYMKSKSLIGNLNKLKVLFDGLEKKSFYIAGNIFISIIFIPQAIMIMTSDLLSKTCPKKIDNI